MSNLLLNSSFNYECRTNTRLNLSLENQEKKTVYLNLDLNGKQSNLFLY